MGEKYQGWVKLYREIQGHWLWSEKPFARGQAWVDMILLANHMEHDFLFGGVLTKVKRGSFITSELKLAERWGWSKTKVRAFLKLLETEGMIDQYKDTKKTTISLRNYGVFQEIKTTEKPQKNHVKTTEKHQKDTYKNVKNEKNEKNEKNIEMAKRTPLPEGIASYEELLRRIEERRK